MKCKAKWRSTVKLWLVWCDECETQMWYTYVNGDSRLPHDIAESHARRYHKE